MNFSKAYPELRYAVSGILDKIDRVLQANQLPKGYIKMYLAGGLAMNFYCGSRYTKDMDAFFSHRLLLPDGLIMNYVQADGKPGLLYFDMQYNPTLGMLHEDAQEDAVICDDIGNEHRCIHLYLLSPVDLAISKISRFAEQDRDDILDLAKARLITADTLYQRAMEACSYYVGNTRVVENSIRIICNQVATATINPQTAKNSLS